MRLRSIIVFQHNYMPSYSFHFSAFMSWRWWYDTV